MNFLVSSRTLYGGFELGQGLHILIYSRSMSFGQARRVASQVKKHRFRPSLKSHQLGPNVRGVDLLREL